MGANMSAPEIKPNTIPRCQRCGYVMCEEFDERIVKGMTLLIPNGKYSCLHCKSATVQGRT